MIKQEIFLVVAITSSISYALLVILLYFLMRYLLKPVRVLTKGAEKIGKGNLKYKVKVESKDELGQLAHSFNKMVESLLKANKELKELDKMKDEFLNTTSHELKTPLIPIKSQLQLLLAEDFGKISPEQKESLEMIYRNEKRLDAFISDLLDISRIRSRKLKLVLQNTSLKKIIQELFEEMGPVAQKKKIDLILKPFDVPKLVVDPKRIRQVFSNLLNNGIKFTPQKGKIIIEAKPIKNDVLVKIIDSGIGISSKNIKKLFTPFFQVETGLVRKQRGTGLGLPICKGIIKAHKGKIWAESKGEGKGSTFSFTLPLAGPGIF